MRGRIYKSMMRCLYYVILEATFSINSSLVVVQHKRVVKFFFFVLQSYLVISCELDNFIFCCFFFSALVSPVRTFLGQWTRVKFLIVLRMCTCWFFLNCVLFGKNWVTLSKYFHNYASYKKFLQKVSKIMTLIFDIILLFRKKCT